MKVNITEKTERDLNNNYMNKTMKNIQIYSKEGIIFENDTKNTTGNK